MAPPAASLATAQRDGKIDLIDTAAARVRINATARPGDLVEMDDRLRALERGLVEEIRVSSRSSAVAWHTLGTSEWSPNSTTARIN